MKAMTLALLLFWGLQSGASQQQQEPPPELQPPFSLQGVWTLTSRMCSSGQWPGDGFVPGRDRLEATFTGTRFTTVNEAGGCSIWTAGFYELRGPVLVMRAERSDSSCGTAPNPPTTFSYPFEALSDHAFLLRMGPSGFGGPCPQGDLLENVFERVDNRPQSSGLR